MGNSLFPERLIVPPKVTYYPDKPIDYSSLPVPDEYPVVNQVTLKTLPFLAKVGFIVSSELKGPFVKSEGTLTNLVENNCINLLEDSQATSINKSLAGIRSALSWNKF